MKTRQTFFSALLLALSCSLCLAQEESSNVPTGFDWLRQFEGTWANIPDDPSSGVENATVSSRVIGNNWLVNVHRADFAGMKFEAIQTLGYDLKKKQYVGTWVDSMMGFHWKYTGVLDDSGKKIILDADGPDMSNPAIMREYRDTYEFKSKDLILATSQMKKDGKWTTFMTAKLKKAPKSKPKTTVTPFLMFIGKAEAAINFYKSVFDDTKVLSMEKYGDEEPNRKGTVKLATIEIAGQPVKCIDSPPVHDFTFTPSFSFFVECESEEQLTERFKKLSDGGKVMMPVNNYGFSKKFGWTSDKFGVSWQLNLP